LKSKQLASPPKKNAESPRNKTVAFANLELDAENQNQPENPPPLTDTFDDFPYSQNAAPKKKNNKKKVTMITPLKKPTFSTRKQKVEEPKKQTGDEIQATEKQAKVRRTTTFEFTSKARTHREASLHKYKQKKIIPTIKKFLNSLYNHHKTNSTK